MIFLVFL